jgi:hypothetical protein
MTNVAVTLVNDGAFGTEEGVRSQNPGGGGMSSAHGMEGSRLLLTDRVAKRQSGSPPPGARSWLLDSGS